MQSILFSSKVLRKQGKLLMVHLMVLHLSLEKSILGSQTKNIGIGHLVDARVRESQNNISTIIKERPIFPK